MNSKNQVPEWLLNSGEIGICPCGCIGKRKKVSFLEKTMLLRGYKGEPVIMNRFKFTLLDFQWLLGVIICILAVFGGEIILG